MIEGWLWIPLTLMAAAAQAVRTAGQKHLTRQISPVAATLVRFLFGLPFAAAYLWIVVALSNEPLPPFNRTFVVYGVLASISQILATVLLIYLFTLRNFAVGTTYARTEVFITALLGVAFFGAELSPAGWIAIGVSVAGVVAINVARTGLNAGGLLSRFWNRSAAVGLICGLFFSLSSLYIRDASLSFGISNFLLAAGLTLVAIILIETVILVVYVAVREPEQFAIMFRAWPVCTFVGVTSAIGSAGWFTAFTLERAAYVKALGQIEIFFALLISMLFFGEVSVRREITGMALVAVGIVILLVFG